VGSRPPTACGRRRASPSGAAGGRANGVLLVEAAGEERAQSAPGKRLDAAGSAVDPARSHRYTSGASPNITHLKGNLEMRELNANEIAVVSGAVSYDLGSLSGYFALSGDAMRAMYYNDGSYINGDQAGSIWD
jgi:hypothetical protein